MPVKYMPKLKAFRYGTTGKVYKVSEFGKKGAEERAKKQGAAIHISQAKSIQVKSTSRARGYERRV
jgi:hypothetical protein